MKKFILITALIVGSGAFAMDYEKVYNKLCIKCHGADGEKKARGVGGPFSRFTKDEIVERLHRFLNGEVVEKPKTSRLMVRVLKRAGIHTDEDIEGMADYIISLRKK